ncbi:MAG: Fic family protein [Bacteroidia bacterium]
MTQLLTLTPMSPEWLGLSIASWEAAAPGWYNRKNYLEEQGDLAAYERDLFYARAAALLQVENLAHLSPAALEALRLHGYTREALGVGEVSPNPTEVFMHLERSVEAYQTIWNQPLSVEAVHRLYELLTGQAAQYRTSAKPNFLAAEAIPTALSTLIYQVSEGLTSDPVHVTAYFHHAFTQIHPFEDANGRLAFILTDKILKDAGLPAFHVLPSHRVEYLRALRAADQGNPSAWVDFFSHGLIHGFLHALNWGYPHNRSYEEILPQFENKLSRWRFRQDKERSQRIIDNRYVIFDYVEGVLKNFVATLEGRLSEDKKGARAMVAKAYPDSPYYFQFTSDIVRYCEKQNFYFNRALPRGWFKLKFYISANKKYQLVFPIFHIGHEDTTLAIGGFLQFLEPKKYQNRPRGRNRPHKTKVTYLVSQLPLEIEPLILNVEKDVSPSKPLLEGFLREVIAKGLVEISNEIY